MSDRGDNGTPPVSGDERGRTYGEAVDAAAAPSASAAPTSESASASASASPARPARPAYGEYATPDEQRAAIRVPLDSDEGVPVVADASTTVAPADHDGHAASSPSTYGERIAGHGAPSGAPARNGESNSTGSDRTRGARDSSVRGSGSGRRDSVAPRAATPPGDTATASADGTPVVRRDRLATYVLLGFGLFAVLNSVSGISALPQSVKQAFAQMNVTATPPADLLITLGWATAGIHLLMWVVALLWSMRAIRRGKLSWWVPVVCSVIFVVVASIVIFVAFATDPTIMTAIMQRG